MDRRDAVAEGRPRHHEFWMLSEVSFSSVILHSWQIFVVYSGLHVPSESPNTLRWISRMDFLLLPEPAQEGQFLPWGALLYLVEEPVLTTRPTFPASFSLLTCVAKVSLWANTCRPDLKCFIFQNYCCLCSCPSADWSRLQCFKKHDLNHLSPEQMISSDNDWFLNDVS